MYHVNVSICAFKQNRGVTKLDGAWARQEASLVPPCSKLRSFGSKCSLLYWKKYLCHCWDFLATPVIWQPCSDSTPKELRPTSLQPWGKRKH